MPEETRPVAERRLLLDLLRQAHIYLELKMDLCPEQVLFDALPGSTISSIGAIYAHAVVTEDHFTHRRFGDEAPLHESVEWRTKVDLPPRVEQHPSWTSDFRTDIGALREYARAVYAASEDVLARLTDDDLLKPASAYFVANEGSGPAVARRQVPLALLFSDNVTMHTVEHTGEISALLGVRGIKGSRWG